MYLYRVSESSLLDLVWSGWRLSRMGFCLGVLYYCTTTCTVLYCISLTFRFRFLREFAELVWFMGLQYSWFPSLTLFFIIKKIIKIVKKKKFFLISCSDYTVFLSSLGEWLFFPFPNNSNNNNSRNNYTLGTPLFPCTTLYLMQEPRHLEGFSPGYNQVEEVYYILYCSIYEVL
jgi:hypothetical protein